MNTTTLTLLVAAVALTTGCAETPRTDADYGNSVRQMVEAQTLNPDAARNPPEAAPDTGDGQRLETVMEGYRKDVARGVEDVRKNVVISVGD